VLDKAHADTELVRLDRLSRAYNRNQVMLGRTADAADQRVATGRADLPFIQGAVAQMCETRGEAFTMTRGGVRVTSRVDAAESIRVWAQENQTRIASHYDPSSARPLGALGTLGGQTILAAVEPRRYGSDPAITLTVQGVPRTELRLTLASVTADGVGTIRQIENHVDGLPRLAARVREQISVAEREAGQARVGLARPFKHSDALTAAREHVADIGARMTAQPDEGDTPVEVTPTFLEGGREAAAHHETEAAARTAADLARQGLSTTLKRSSPPTGAGTHPPEPETNPRHAGQRR